MKELQSILGNVLLRVSRDVQTPGLLAPLWREVVPGLAAHSSLLSVSDGVLQVRCHSPLWAAALTAQADSLVAEVSKRLGIETPLRLEITVGHTSP
jgi:predicted nucleic acid-binding Zn ribbon protein